MEFALRPRHELRQGRAHHRPGGQGPHGRRPGRQPRRLQPLARGAGRPARRDRRRPRQRRLRRDVADRAVLRLQAAQLPHRRRAGLAAGRSAASQPFRYTGVDPNRNYGGFWGGPGASSLPAYDTYRGAGPFSEPETQNIRDLVSKRQVTTLITNHTFTQPRAAPARRAGAGPAARRGRSTRPRRARWRSRTATRTSPPTSLYDTTGATEDWSYYATGGLGYTFEIGPERVPPAVRGDIDEYLGAGAYAGKGNREAYFIALENTADATKHSVIEGTGPPGAQLRLRKAFLTETSPVRTSRTA